MESIEERTRGRLRAAPRFAALLVALAVAAGCAVGGDRRADPSSAAALVLQREDLAAGWNAFDVGPQSATDVGTRVGGDRPANASWKARYRRGVTVPTQGPLVVESRADVFDDAGEARADLAAVEASLGTFLPGSTAIEAPNVGEQTVAATYVEAGADRSVRYYFLAWRDANVTASLSASGFEERFTLEDVVALARAQERRIDAAVGG